MLHLVQPSRGRMKHNDRLLQLKLLHLCYRTFFIFILHNQIVTAEERICCMHLVALALTENVRVLLEWGADELGLLPQVGGEETVGVGNGNEGGLEGVLKGLGGTGRGGVDVVDTGELEQTLDSWGGDQTGTTWSRNEL